MVDGWRCGPRGGLQRKSVRGNWYGVVRFRAPESIREKLTCEHEGCVDWRVDPRHNPVTGRALLPWAAIARRWNRRCSVAPPPTTTEPLRSRRSRLSKVRKEYQSREARLVLGLPNVESAFRQFDTDYGPMAFGFTGFRLNRLAARDPLHSQNYFVAQPPLVLLSTLVILLLARNACLLLPARGERRMMVWSVQFDKRRRRGRNQLLLPGDFEAQLKGCRHLLMVIELVLEERIGGERERAHQNLLLIDFRDHTVSRFDPKGAITAAHYRPDLLDNRLTSLFRRIDPRLKYLGTAESCASIGIQRLQIDEDVHVPGEPEGWCAAWSLYWLHIRLLNPELTRFELQQKSLATLNKAVEREEIGSLTEFIAAYANTLLQAGVVLVNSVTRPKRPYSVRTLFRDPDHGMPRLAGILSTHLASLLAYIDLRRQ
jgi:2-cysteine adaptor domain